VGHIPSAQGNLNQLAHLRSYSLTCGTHRSASFANWCLCLADRHVGPPCQRPHWVVLWSQVLPTCGTSNSDSSPTIHRDRFLPQHLIQIPTNSMLPIQIPTNSTFPGHMPSHILGALCYISSAAIVEQRCEKGISLCRVKPPIPRCRVLGIGPRSFVVSRGGW
jgi:hypothetical protein